MAIYSSLNRFGNLLHTFDVDRGQKVFLGGEVIVEVRLRQPRHVGDQLHGGTPESRLGKDLFGGVQDGAFILAPDVRAAAGLQAGNLGVAAHGSCDFR